MTKPEMLSPFSSLLLLILGIIGNLVLAVNYNRGGYSRTQSKIAFLFTLVILGLTVPYFYSTFKLDLGHFLEHSLLKLLFVFGAINLIFLISVRPLPMLHIPQNMIDKATITVTSQIDDSIEELYNTIEVGVFSTGISRVSTKSARFLDKLLQLSFSFDIQTYTDKAPEYVQNILEPIERAINWLWNLLATKSETIPHILSNIQTGLLSNNLILVLCFLILFLILLILVPGG